MSGCTKVRVYIVNADGSSRDPCAGRPTGRTSMEVRTNVEMYEGARRTADGFEELTSLRSSELPATF